MLPEDSEVMKCSLSLPYPNSYAGRWRHHGVFLEYGYGNKGACFRNVSPGRHSKYLA